VKHETPDCDKRTLAQIAEERGKDPFDIYLDLICEDPDGRGVCVAETGNFPCKPYRSLSSSTRPTSWAWTRMWWTTRGRRCRPTRYRG